MAPQNDSVQVSSSEEAARRSRRGYEYQDLIAASFCLKMLVDDTLRVVACETQDDVVLTWSNNQSGEFQEFVQVKSDRLTQQWSVSKFCEQESEKSKPPHRRDSSIFEKNASRDQGRRAARFRIVSRADINKDLRVLIELPDQQVPNATGTLAKLLEKQLNGNTSLTTKDIDYWTTAATWEVRGSEDAVFNENYRLLSETVESTHRRLLSVVQLERILHLLDDQARAMATGKGRFGMSSSAVTQNEIREWLTAEISNVPHFLETTEIDALLREERHSLARCETLWIALGVPSSEAEALARQPEIGARSEFFTELNDGFHLITSTYGAGKSLAVERLFQCHLADYMAQRDRRIPIFLKAYEIVTSLKDAVLARLHDLQQHDGSPSLFVIVDAMDEAGIRGHRLLREAYELCKAWPDSTFLATSTDIQGNFGEFQRQLPLLSKEQAAEIVSHFAHSDFYPWMLHDRLDADSGLALMCVLLGLALRETAQAIPSRGELLNRVVEAAQKRSEGDTEKWAAHFDHLCRIAMLSTDSDGGPIRIAELRMSPLELTPLYTTRLVSEESGNLVFTVATIRIWFAAQALRKGLLDEKQLFDDLPRTRYWQKPLAILIATADFESAARYFEPLASAHPAIAANVIADSTSKWGDGKPRKPTEYLDFALRIRRCLEAWLRGINPLSNMCGFTDRNGELLKVMAGFSSPYTVIVFSDDASLPPASLLPPNWDHRIALSFHTYKEPDEPSHLWRQTQEMVCTRLRKALEEVEWKRHPLFVHEEAWNQVCGFTGASRWFSSSVPWENIAKKEVFFRHGKIWDWLCQKREESPTAFLSPHPAADINDNTTSWIPSFYSEKAALSYAKSVYSMALTAYQVIVRKSFPHFTNDLKHSDLWPCKLVGEICKVEGHGMSDWWISYYLEPVNSESEAIVNFGVGAYQRFLSNDKVEALQALNILLRPNSNPRFWWQSSVLKTADTHPAASLVKEWLLSDLQSAGW